MKDDYYFTIYEFHRRSDDFAWYEKSMKLFENNLPRPGLIYHSLPNSPSRNYICFLNQEIPKENRILSGFFNMKPIYFKEFRKVEWREVKTHTEERWGGRIMMPGRIITAYFDNLHLLFNFDVQENLYRYIIETHVINSLCYI